MTSDISVQTIQRVMSQALRRFAEQSAIWNVVQASFSIIVALRVAASIDEVAANLIEQGRASAWVDWYPLVAVATLVAVVGIWSLVGFRQSGVWVLGTTAVSATLWGSAHAALEVSRAIETTATLTDAIESFHQPTAAAIAVCFALTIVCGKIMYDLSKHDTDRSKSRVFGRADWMSMEAARRLFPEDGEIVVGEAYRVDLDLVGRLPFDGADRRSWGQGGRARVLGFNLNFDSTHMIFFAGSGGFKTTSTVVPTALRYTGSMAVLDPSGEVGPVVTAARERMGRKVVCLDPAASTVSGFDPFSTLVDSDRLEEDCAAFARLFIAESKSAGGGSAEYFQAQAMNLLAGLLYLVAKDREFQDARKLTKVRALVALPTKEMTAFLARKVADKATPLFVRENLGQFVGMADQTFSGVLSSVAKDTAWLSIPAYAQMVTRETFALSEIPDGNIDVFIQVPGETLMTYPAIGRVIVGTITKAMVQANGAHKKRLLLVLDEVDLLGYMSVLTEVRDRGRKYGMTLMMLYQSIGQVENHYGKEGATSWLEGCSFVSYAAIKSMETAEAVSERCGDMTVDVTGQSEAYAPLLSKRDPNRSTSTSLQSRKLILPHEVVQDMRADEQIVMVRGHPPLRCGRAIYFRRQEMLAAAAVNRFAGKGGGR